MNENKFNNKEICQKLLALPPSSMGKNPTADFLLETFAGYPEEFCYFTGCMKTELSIIKISCDKAVEIMSDIALAALSIGRMEGEDYSLRHYGRPEFQFLLKNGRGAA